MGKPPCGCNEVNYMSIKKSSAAKELRNLAVTICCLLFSTGLTGVFFWLSDGRDKGYAGVVFVLGVALTSCFTEGYVWGIVSAIIGTLMVNWAFTVPFMEFDITPQGYALTFFVMLAVAVLISMLTTQIKKDGELNAAAHREKMRADLLRSLSHDIRTPLTSISTASSAILENQDTLPDSAKTELIADVKREADWLIRAFENILTITRVDMCADSFTKKPEAAEEVIGEVIAMFSKRSKNVNVVIDLPEELVIVPMDALLIEQVLKNLLENVADHGGSATEAVLKLRITGSRAVFSVADNGDGIPEPLLGHLFDADALEKIKFNGDTTRGMGIGLELCRSVVTLHGGEIRGYNKDRGAVFEFWLPME